MLGECVGMGATILVVEDEPAISELIAAVLRYEGFEVITAMTGNDGVRATRAQRPDLILLDVMLPDGDGFRVQERLNLERDETPIVFLTAKDTPADKVRGLTLGADDYITKPFNVDELVARVKTVLRRAGKGAALAGDGSVLRFADLVLEEDAREVRRGATRVDLTPTEYNLLHYLMVNAKRVLTKAQILDHVWNYDFDGDAGVVETYIFYLRRKLDGLGPSLIHTVRGVGYCLRLPAEASS
jgi:two-component system, OmpR family, response regulator